VNHAFEEMRVSNKSHLDSFWQRMAEDRQEHQAALGAVRKDVDDLQVLVQELTQRPHTSSLQEQWSRQLSATEASAAAARSEMRDAAVQQDAKMNVLEATCGGMRLDIGKAMDAIQQLKVTVQESAQQTVLTSLRDQMQSRINAAEVSIAEVHREMNELGAQQDSKIHTLATSSMSLQKDLGKTMETVQSLTDLDATRPAAKSICEQLQSQVSAAEVSLAEVRREMHALGSHQDAKFRTLESNDMELRTELRTELDTAMDMIQRLQVGAQEAAQQMKSMHEPMQTQVALAEVPVAQQQLADLVAQQDTKLHALEASSNRELHELAAQQDTKLQALASSKHELHELVAQQDAKLHALETSSMNMRIDLGKAMDMVQQLSDQPDRLSSGYLEALSLAKQAVERSTDMSGVLTKLDSKVMDMERAISLQKADMSSMLSQHQALGGSMQAAERIIVDLHAEMRAVREHSDLKASEVLGEALRSYKVDALQQIEHLRQAMEEEKRERLALASKIGDQLVPAAANSADSLPTSYERPEQSPGRMSVASSCDTGLIDAAFGREKAALAARGDLPSQLRNEFASRVDSIEVKLRAEIDHRLHSFSHDVLVEMSTKIGSLDTDLRCEIAARMKVLEGELQRSLRGKLMMDKNQMEIVGPALTMLVDQTVRTTESPKRAASPKMAERPCAFPGQRSGGASMTVPCGAPGRARGGGSTPTMSQRSVSPGPHTALGAASARSRGQSPVAAEKARIEQQLEIMRLRAEEACQGQREDESASNGETASDRAPFFSDELKDSLVRLASKVNTALKSQVDAQSNASHTSSGSTQVPSLKGRSAFAGLSATERPVGSPGMTDTPSAGASRLSTGSSAHMRSATALDALRARPVAASQASADYLSGTREGRSPLTRSAASVGTPAGPGHWVQPLSARSGTSLSRASPGSSVASPSLRSSRFPAAQAFQGSTQGASTPSMMGAPRPAGGQRYPSRPTSAMPMERHL